MALGYTIAAILKRSSHIFSDERVHVKIDWLEQLKRHYVQVVHLSFFPPCYHVLRSHMLKFYSAFLIKFIMSIVSVFLMF